MSDGDVRLQGDERMDGWQSRWREATKVWREEDGENETERSLMFCCLASHLLHPSFEVGFDWQIEEGSVYFISSGCKSRRRTPQKLLIKGNAEKNFTHYMSSFVVFEEQLNTCVCVLLSVILVCFDRLPSPSSHWLIFRKCRPSASKSERGSLFDCLEACRRTDGSLVNEKWHSCEMLRETDTDWLDEGVWMEAGGEKNVCDSVTGRCQRVEVFFFHCTEQHRL